MSAHLNLNLNEVFHLRDSGCSNGEDNAQMARHRWYVMKESFSPRLLTRAVEATGMTKGTVLDPFSGSGTVPLASKHLGLEGIGIEVNPFLAFVGRTKAIRASSWRLAKHMPSVIGAIRKGERSPLEAISTFSVGGGSEKWLFNRPVLRGFEGGWLETKRCTPRFRSLLRLALIGAAMDTCNALPDGKCLRYRRRWKELAFSKRDFLEAFEARVDVMREDLKVDPGSGDAEIVNSDCRSWLAGKGSSFDLCVTSPPYLNSFDYSDVYRPELFLGKFVDSNEALRRIRLKTVRSHVQAEWERPVLDDFGNLYRDRIKLLQDHSDLLWSRRIPMMIQAYFEDMNRILLHLRKICRPGASLWMVVSTSAYGGVEFPVDLILAEIGTRVGWYLREIGVLRYLRTSGQNWSRFTGLPGAAPRLRESVVIFDAGPLHRAKRS